MDNRSYFTGDLLDDLQVMAGFAYLSELRESKNREKALDYLEKINPSTYSLKQWSIAVTYIVGENIVLSTYEEVKEQIDKLRGTC